VGEVEDSGEGEAEAEDGSGSGEDERFSDQLADDAAACRSECGAHGELLGAGSCAGEQEVREVNADDEKDESDGSPEDDERAAEAAGDEVLEVPELGGVVAFVSTLDTAVEGGKMRSASAWAWARVTPGLRRPVSEIMLPYSRT
jgi:hypothetical protein